MSTYETLRHFADSWGLLFLVIFFLGVVVYTLRPGSRSTHDDIADIPFRHEKAPAANDAVERAQANGDQHG
ncbi:MAG: cbb3-type cytochrome c oxidase subunit 3 [Pseudomonadota bacterium]